METEFSYIYFGIKKKYFYLNTNVFISVFKKLKELIQN